LVSHQPVPPHSVADTGEFGGGDAILICN